MADRGGISDPAGGRGAGTAGGQDVLPRGRVAGAPGGSGAVAGRGHRGPPRALDGADSGTGLASALGRAVPCVRSDGDRVMSDEIRLSATTVNAPDALALAMFYAELTGG